MSTLSSARGDIRVISPLQSTAVRGSEFRHCPLSQYTMIEPMLCVSHREREVCLEGASSIAHGGAPAQVGSISVTAHFPYGLLSSISVARSVDITTRLYVFHGSRKFLHMVRQVTCRMVSHLATKLPLAGTEVARCGACTPERPAPGSLRTWLRLLLVLISQG